MRTHVGNAWWWALALLVAAAPLPIACVNTEWRMPLALACMAVGAVGVVSSGASGIDRTVLVLAGFVAWASLALLPCPEWVLRSLSAERTALPPPPAPAPSTISVYTGATLERVLTLVGLFYVVWALSRRPSRAPFRILAVVGTLHAVFAFVLSETGGTTATRSVSRVLWIYEWPEVYTPVGTYVNKNHFAGLAVIGAAACLGILARRWASAIERVSHMGRRGIAAVVTERRFFRLFVPGVGFLVNLLALFASGSRGAAAGFVAAFLLVPLAAGLMDRRFRPGSIVASVLLVAAVAAAATAGGDGSVLDRIVPGGRYLNRPKLWRDSVAMSLEYPVAGTGLGTFQHVFPRHQTFEPERNFSHAESDAVQYLTETGFVGLGLLAVFGGLVLLRAVRLLRRGGQDRALAMGATIGLVAVLLHGMVDVNLHIPANMLAAAVLVGGILGFEEGSRSGMPMKRGSSPGGNE